MTFTSLKFPCYFVALTFLGRCTQKPAEKEFLPFTHSPTPQFILLFLIFFLSTVIVSGQNSELKIALLQMPSNSDIDWNLKKGDAFCREAKEKGADIALFPELINIGYQAVDYDEPEALHKWKSMAIGKDSKFVTHFKSLAKELDMAIVITYLESTEDLPKNSASLIDRFGNIIMTYSKVHTVDPFKMESAMTPGEDFYVADLETKAGIVKIGMMICYDREFPESARILMLKGAEIILTPNACGLDSMRIRQFQTRAWENAVATVMTNYARTDEGKGLNGHSCAYFADGSTILMSDEKEGVNIATVKLQELRKYRDWTFWGNAYRRPHKYNELISPEVEDPFKRKNGFGKEFKRLER